jgi:ribonucleoside-diphosphate reductase alpha chain
VILDVFTEIGFAFNKWILGDETMKRLGFTKEQTDDFNFNLLKALGFTKEQIEEANVYICGRMTVEGAPHLKPEHLPVFDCANKCGKIGKRFIHGKGGHLAPVISAWTANILFATVGLFLIRKSA